MLDFYIMHNPDIWDEGTWWHAGGMPDGEWSALFYDSFGCFMGKNEPYIEGEPIGNWNERVRTKFQSAIPDYPLLGRMWDIYGAYWYPPEELAALRAECLRASVRVSDWAARSGLDNLAQACDKAIMLRAGLHVEGD